MTRLNGSYFDGRSPVAVGAAMDFDPQEATLTSGDLVERYSISDLKVSPRIGKSDRFITLPNKGQFSCPDDISLDSLPQESPSEGLVAWLEERWGIALASVAIIFCMLAAIYFFALPAAAERIAVRTPMNTEQSIGNQAINWLDRQRMFRPSELDAASRKRITDSFVLLHSGLPFNEYFRLEFRRGGAFFGSNAIALPGGIIVITDELVKDAATDEEIIAVLAHEIAHQELRHTMRSVFQDSVVAMAVATITSDSASASNSVAGFS